MAEWDPLERRPTLTGCVEKLAVAVGKTPPHRGRLEVMTETKMTCSIPHSQIQETELTVFYDGSCPLCCREIDLFRRSEIGHKVDWQDVSIHPGDVVVDGLTKSEALARFHVRTSCGKMLVGAAAFVELWSRHKRLRIFTKALSNRPSLYLLEFVYRGFLFVRPLLQRVAKSLDERNTRGPT